MTDEELAQQIPAKPDAAPNMAPEIEERAIRRTTGMTQAQFVAAHESAAERCRTGSAA
jgi:hypothetical protein